MNKRLMMVLVFAFVVASCASLVIYRFISVQMAANAKAAGSMVLVASHNLDTGALIKDFDVTLAEWGGALPLGALAKPDDAIGRGVVQPILSGEPIVESRIAAKGAGAGLAATIPPGMRAVAVRVNDIVGVAGFVSPGTKVDILIAGNPPGATQSTVGTLTKTLLQNVEVLSAGQNIQKDAEGKPVSVGVVNMLVTPEQAEILSLASNETRIQLILRNPMDKEVTQTPGTAIAYLFNGGKAPAPAPAPAYRPPAPRVAAPVAAPAPAPTPAKPVATPPMTITIEVIHGASRAESKFQADAADKATSPEGK